MTPRSVKQNQLQFIERLYIVSDRFLHEAGRYEDTHPDGTGIKFFWAFCTCLEKLEGWLIQKVTHCILIVCFRQTISLENQTIESLEKGLRKRVKKRM